MGSMAGRQGSMAPEATAASKRQSVDSKGRPLAKPISLMDKMRNLIDPRRTDGSGDKPNMPIPKVKWK